MKKLLIVAILPFIFWVHKLGAQETKWWNPGTWETEMTDWGTYALNKADSVIKPTASLKTKWREGQIQCQFEITPPPIVIKVKDRPWERGFFGVYLCDDDGFELISISFAYDGPTGRESVYWCESDRCSRKIYKAAKRWGVSYSENIIWK